MKKGLISLVIVAAAALFISGCAARKEKITHEGLSGKTITVATGDFYEACDKWEPGTKIKFSYTSSKPVKFNVHYHEKHKKEYPVKDIVADEFGGSFIVESPATYCCMWKNENQNFVTLTYGMSVEEE